MSNLHRSAISARAAKLPDLPPIPAPDVYDEVDEEDEMDTLGDLPSSMGPPSSIPHSKNLKPLLPVKHKLRPPNPNFAPISASAYFGQALQVELPRRGLDVRVYWTESTTPGAKESNETIVICHHGAGYSGLSFACLAKELTSRSAMPPAVSETGSWNPTAAPWASSHDEPDASGQRKALSVLAFDSRGHGKTRHIHREIDLDDEVFDESDLSIQTLSRDLEALVCKLWPNPNSSEQNTPKFLLLGHSMGGAVVTRVCPLLQDLGYVVHGAVVLDVVEGSAIEALPHMHALLDTRPSGFGSIEEGTEWHVTTKTIRNPISARVSVPSILIPNPAGTDVFPPYIWRTPLRSTAPFWRGWFTSLSSLFLSLRTARLLILAGTDRLDKELMIGQMQGKFQCVVLPGVGHVIQEDDPAKLAEVIVEFWRKNERLANLPGVKVRRVGDA